MASTTRYRRGDIVLVPFPFTDLSSSKRRPALVISPDAFNDQTADLVVAAITSQLTNDHAVTIHLVDRRHRDRSLYRATPDPGPRGSRHHVRARQAPRTHPPRVGYWRRGQWRAIALRDPECHRHPARVCRCRADRIRQTSFPRLSTIEWTIRLSEAERDPAIRVRLELDGFGSGWLLAVAKSFVRSIGIDAQAIRGRRRAVAGGCSVPPAQLVTNGR